MSFYSPWVSRQFILLYLAKVPDLVMDWRKRSTSREPLPNWQRTVPMAPEAIWRSPSHHFSCGGSLVSICSMTKYVRQSLCTELTGRRSLRVGVGAELSTRRRQQALEEAMTGSRTRRWATGQPHPKRRREARGAGQRQAPSGGSGGGEERADTCPRGQQVLLLLLQVPLALLDELVHGRGALGWRGRRGSQRGLGQEAGSQPVPAPGLLLADDWQERRRAAPVRGGGGPRYPLAATWAAPSIYSPPSRGPLRPVPAIHRLTGPGPLPLALSSETFGIVISPLSR